MNSKKQIKIGVSSSLIDLKAELLKKQRELEQTKSRQKGVTKSISKTQILKSKKLTNKKNSGVEKRNAADLEEHEKSMKTYEKAKEVLEAKAKLYDKMQAEALHHEVNTHPVLSNSLVDFQRKAIDSYQEAKRKSDKTSDNNDIDPDKSFSLTSIRDVDGVDDEMVEFIDTLGRTRRCKRSQLAKAMATDEQLAREEKSTTGADSNPNNNNNSVIKSNASGKLDDGDIKAAVYSAVPPPTVLNLSNMMTEEQVTNMKHRKWEDETEAATAKNDVHYQDVLFDEIRNHGVAYYGFSKDEEKRAEEIRELKKLSQHTKNTREKVKKERDQKSKQLKVRLLKIKNKKRAKLGLPPLEESPDNSDDDNEEKETEQHKDAEANKEGVEEASKSKELRAWDFGKSGVFGPKPVNFDELDAKWLHDRRGDRSEDFAPPTVYTQNKNYKLATAGISTSSYSSSSSSSSKYGNFVQSMENAMRMAPPPPPPSQKQQQKLYDASPNLYRQQEQLPTRINDELPSLTPDSVDHEKRGKKGAEVSPPTNYGESEPPRKKSNICETGSIFNSISEGVRALREQVERKQKAQQQKVEKQSFFSKTGPEAEIDDDDED